MEYQLKNNIYTSSCARAFRASKSRSGKDLEEEAAIKL
jgi:hypothetical protein